MASLSVRCPKCAAGPRPSPSLPRTSLASAIGGSGRFSPPPPPPPQQGLNARRISIPNAQIQEVLVKGSSNSSPLAPAESATLLSNSIGSDVLKEPAVQAPVSDLAISMFLAEASRLVMLVDSKDVSEVKLNYKDCELIIRKKEALVQPAPIGAPIMHQPQAVRSPQLAMPEAIPLPAPATSAATALASPLALPPPVKGGSKSSLPPLKSPMAGTFYRSPAPGEPPFVKVGDKVNKGQVVCIIEAMKLMNDIEADQSGTVVEILVENGKPVSLDTPLLIIQP